MTFDEALALSKSEQVRHRRVMKENEHYLQCACFNWFNIEFPEAKGLLFAIPNGGYRDERTAAKLKAEGVVAGVADLFLAVANHGYNGLFIEMKTKDKSSRQRPSQREFQKRVERQNYKYIVCRTYEQFRDNLIDYYGKKGTRNN